MFALDSDPLRALLIDWLNDGLPRAEQNIIEGIRQRAPVDTGALRESLDIDVTGSGSNVVIGIESRFASTSEYGLFQDEGRSGFPIRVRNARVLSDGNSIFGTEVQHPGYTKHVGWWSDAPWLEWLVKAYQ